MKKHKNFKVIVSGMVNFEYVEFKNWLLSFQELEKSMRKQ